MTRLSCILAYSRSYSSILETLPMNIEDPIRLVSASVSLLYFSVAIKEIRLEKQYLPSSMSFRQGEHDFILMEDSMSRHHKHKNHFQFTDPKYSCHRWHCQYLIKSKFRCPWHHVSQHFDNSNLLVHLNYLSLVPLHAFSFLGIFHSVNSKGSLFFIWLHEKVSSTTLTRFTLLLHTLIWCCSLWIILTMALPLI